MSLEWLHLGIPYGWLVVPLAITVISAVAQVIAKLRARKVLNDLRDDLEAARFAPPQPDNRILSCASNSSAANWGWRCRSVPLPHCRPGRTRRKMTSPGT